jgi:hypothetical protein
MRGALATLGLAVLIFSSTPAAARLIEAQAPSTITLTTFLADLDRVIDAVGRIVFPADAPAVAASVSETSHVAVGSQQIAVDWRWLTAALTRAPERPDAWPATRTSVERRLREIRAHASALAEAGAPGERAEARVTLQTILSREEFKQSPSAAWRERWQRRIGEWLQDFWSRFGGPRLAGPTIARGFAWIAAVGALLGLTFWFVRLLQRPRGAVLSLGAGSPGRPPAREWALRALAAARAGEARDAVRAAFNAALLRLEEEGAWRVDESRTPREYLHLLGRDHGRRPVMLDLTQRFEQIWYGNRTVSTDDVRCVTTHLETLGCLHAGERAM